METDEKVKDSELEPQLVLTEALPSPFEPFVEVTLSKLSQQESEPPQTPQLSKTLPLQSQAPSAMPAPPQTPHSSRTFPSQSQVPSVIPAPPQTPHSSFTESPPQTPAQSWVQSGTSGAAQVPQRSVT